MQAKLKDKLPFKQVQMGRIGTRGDTSSLILLKTWLLEINDQNLPSMYCKSYPSIDTNISVSAEKSIGDHSRYHVSKHEISKHHQIGLMGFG